MIRVSMGVPFICRLHSMTPVGRSLQRGVALPVALVLLVVVTLVGFAAIRETILQQKMAANFYDREIAFQANEAAVRQAEAAIRNATSTVPAGFLDCSPTSGNVCQADPFNDAKVPASAISEVPTTLFDGGTLVAGKPQYIVQYMGNFAIPIPNVKQISGCSGYLPCNNTHTADFYRITARSGPADVGGRASVVLQSVFRK
jgi:type IV pilus assembly protein PilX